MIRSDPLRQVEASLLLYVSKVFYEFHCGVDVGGGFEEVVQVEVLIDKFFDVGMAFSIFVCTSS